MIQEYYYFLGALAFVISAMLWVNSQFSKVKEQIIKSNDKILDKLEYHERHDDDRFGRMDNKLTEIRINQAKYGINGKTGQEVKP